jgi:hypothetical protein
VFRLIRIIAIAAIVAGCAAHPARPAGSALPTLHLSPSSLGRELALQQRLEIGFGDKSQTLDALLEVDSKELRLGVQAMGQTALTLNWDGKLLREHRADWLPPSLTGDGVLFDLQLVYWPAQTIRAALPVDWTLEDSAGHRRLLHAGAEVVAIDYLSADHVLLTQAHESYRLDITSAQAERAGQ